MNRAHDPSIELSPSDGSVRALGASAVLGFWSSLATCAPHHFLPATTSFDYGHGFQTAETCSPPVEQAVVYSTSTTGLSTLTFRGGVVAEGGGVEERSEVMYWHRGAYIIYYRDITGHSCIA